MSDHTAENDAGCYCSGSSVHPQCPTHAKAWLDKMRPTDPSVFIGSGALMDALFETYCDHIGIVEPDGPDGPYMWCECGWRSDSLGYNSTPGNSYAVHLTNAQHAAAVKALQPIVRRVIQSEVGQP